MFESWKGMELLGLLLQPDNYIIYNVDMGC